jgi:hypothetical protein
VILYEEAHQDALLQLRQQLGNIFAVVQFFTGSGMWLNAHDIVKIKREVEELKATSFLKCDLANGSSMHTRYLTHDQTSSKRTSSNPISLCLNPLPSSGTSRETESLSTADTLRPNSPRDAYGKMRDNQDPEDIFQESLSTNTTSSKLQKQTPTTLYSKRLHKADRAAKTYNGFTYWKSLDRVPFTDTERKNINIRNAKWAMMWNQMSGGKIASLKQH